MENIQEQGVPVKLSLYKANSGFFRVLVNDEVKPDLVGFETVQQAVEQAWQRFPGTEVELGVWAQHAERVLYALCFQDTLNSEHRKYVGQIKSSSTHPLDQALTAFTTRDKAVDLWDAVKYELPLDAAMAMKASGQAPLLQIVPVVVSFDHK